MLELFILICIRPNEFDSWTIMIIKLTSIFIIYYFKIARLNTHKFIQMLYSLFGFRYCNRAFRWTNTLFFKFLSTCVIRFIVCLKINLSIYILIYFILVNLRNQNLMRLTVMCAIVVHTIIILNYNWVIWNWLF
jgi:hypothetical protein